MVYAIYYLDQDKIQRGECKTLVHAFVAKTIAERCNAFLGMQKEVA